MAKKTHVVDGRVKPLVAKAGVTRGTRTYSCGGKVQTKK